MPLETVDHFPVTEFACKSYTAPDGYHPAVPYPDEWVADRLKPLKRVLEKIPPGLWKPRRRGSLRIPDRGVQP